MITGLHLTEEETDRIDKTLNAETSNLVMDLAETISKLRQLIIEVSNSMTAEGKCECSLCSYHKLEIKAALEE